MNRTFVYIIGLAPIVAVFMNSSRVTEPEFYLWAVIALALTMILLYFRASPKKVLITFIIYWALLYIGSFALIGLLSLG